MNRILTIVGARPQFIKAAAVSRAIYEAGAQIATEIMVHTGQHHDANMSQVFFDQLDIPAPAYNLEISGGSHGKMTGRMLEAIEDVMHAEKPDWVLIYGDTNSTLAGALAAAKLHVPVAHVEAGLRSFNMKMPEEVNRILSDRVSSLLLCPTETAVENLAREGITEGVHNIGDVMFDVALLARQKAQEVSDAVERYSLEKGAFVLATCHRAENTDNRQRLTEVLKALDDLSKDQQVVFPLHPRTRKKIAEFGCERFLGDLLCTDPLPFLDMVQIEQSAGIIVTDSGGVQKEAFFYGVPCVTMRDETEWTETVRLGWNRIAGADRQSIVAAARNFLRNRPDTSREAPYGDGNAAQRVLSLMA